MQRRNLLKTVGGVGAASALGIGGMAVMSGGAAAASGLSMSATSPAAVSNDRGDLTKVTIDPSFRVDWENFDTAVGKVMILIEARTIEDGNVQGEGWTPVFRTTPWLTEDMEQNGGPHIDYSKPGTTGYLEITGTLGEAMAYASRVRTGNNAPSARPLEVVNEQGRPDYEGADWSSHPTDYDTFLDGSSLGGAGDADALGLPLVNNFPGADAGYYGAAINTDNFDVDDDGTTDTDAVELRYTVAFYAPTFVDSADAGSGWYEHVRQSDINETDGQGNSNLVMNGEDGYPDITDIGGIGSPATNHYNALRSIANSHPAVMTETTSFSVTVENEGSTTGGSGSSNGGAQGSGQ